MNPILFYGLVALELWVLLVVIVERFTRTPKHTKQQPRRTNGQYARKVKIGGMGEGAIYL